MNSSKISSLVLFLILAFLPALSGVFAKPGEWYQSLNKPFFNPPSWVFGPVWTCLYVSIGISAWLVFQQTGIQPTAPRWIFFMAQLVLNGLWTILFFGLHQPGWAFLEIVVLEITILGTIALFWKVSPPAGIILLPYALWVGFASILNFALWRLNAGSLG